MNQISTINIPSPGSVSHLGITKTGIFFIRNVNRIVFCVHLLSQKRTMNRIIVISVVIQVIVISVTIPTGMV
jgi:hypothetical protein